MNGRSALICEVCILAGGLSTRMGRDKARLRLGGRTLLAHIRANARALGVPVRVIRRDLVPRCGPLGGVITALRTTRALKVLFLSCDMPFVTPALLRKVRARFRSGPRSLFVVENGVAGFPFALRHEDLASAEEQMAARTFSLQSLAAKLEARRLRLPRAQATELFNVNTPEDWVAARKRVDTRGRV